MKLNPNLIRSGALACACAATLLFTGCASTPADRAASMAGDVTQVSKQLESSRAAVTQVLTTLNQLVTQPSGDMRGQYKDYLDSVKNLQKTSDKVDASVNTMQVASEAYFADWGNQIAAMNDSTLKQLNTERKQQAISSLADLKANVQKVRAAYQPLARDLNDIGLYLGNNLTTDGITAMKPRLDDIKVEAVSVRDALSNAAQSLSQFSATLATPAK
jgi:hypothetical protein